MVLREKSWEWSSCIRKFLKKNEYKEVGWCIGEGWCPHSTVWCLRGLVSSSFVTSWCMRGLFSSSFVIGWCLRGLVSSLFATCGCMLNWNIINCKSVLAEEHKERCSVVFCHIEFPCTNFGVMCFLCCVFVFCMYFYLSKSL